MTVNADALDWLAAITLVGVAELITAASFLPVYRHHWRRWRGVSWEAEFPYMWPPLFLNGALWFVVQAVHALGAWAVLRRGWRGSGDEFSDQGAGHAAIALWTASIGLWSLWAVPWEFELTAWSWAAWSGSAWLTGGAAWAVWWSGNTLATVLFSVYSYALGAMVMCNWLVWQYRRWWGPTHPAQTLHKRLGNPLHEWWRWGALPPLYADE